MNRHARGAARPIPRRAPPRACLHAAGMGLAHLSAIPAALAGALFLC
ncbi:hypothetical protein [Zoogloea dura]|uniref:Uncharacterized protein n=1 Tax=Zoogloea dura TaxID=2728840 RepID=A0A848GA48_9RHOO|nr:hypothetical protein [Zoogloea dura]NML28022.1 hypothetical protein [Zoogloea dura]